MQDGSSRLLKAYSTDFESGCVAVVIDESNFDQPVVANQSISSLPPGGECSAFFLATLLAFLLVLAESTSW
jgi:hypothetical protein